MPSATNSGCATFDPSLQVHALPLQQPSATHSMPLKNIVQLLVSDQLRSTLWNVLAVVIGADCFTYIPVVLSSKLND
jgi:hypothetical protein